MVGAATNTGLNMTHLTTKNKVIILLRLILQNIPSGCGGSGLEFLHFNFTVIISNQIHNDFSTKQVHAAVLSSLKKMDFKGTVYSKMQSLLNIMN